MTNLLERDRQGAFLADAASLVRAYREKVVIESSFRDIKSFVEVGPVYVWKEKHVKAHYSLCVLAHLLNRTIDMLLHEKGGSVTADVISHAMLYEELSSCQLNSVAIGQENTHMLTTPSDRHKELLVRVQAEHLTQLACTQRSTMRRRNWIASNQENLSRSFRES